MSFGGVNEEIELKHILDNILTQNGEIDKLRDLLNSRLSDCGWREEVKLACREVIREKGITSISHEQVVQAVTPIARGKVPAEVKKELLEKLKNSLIKELEAKEMRLEANQKN